jgi:hypothetical protein
LIVADAGYGDAAEFRQALGDRTMTYVVGVNSAHTAFTIDTKRTAPPYKGAGRPALIYRQAAPSLKTLSWPPGAARPAGSDGGPVHAAARAGSRCCTARSCSCGCARPVGHTAAPPGSVTCRSAG